MWSPYQFFLTGLMMVTGSINTLSTKWADLSNATGCPGTSTEHVSHPFNHPFLQSLGMFIGELSCLGVFHILRLIWRKVQHESETSSIKPLVDGNQSFNPLIFLPPAMCDMCATTLMYIGLTMTYASSFQMLRGAVIVFTALLSVAFLQRTIKNYMWMGIVSVILGLAVVGVSDYISEASKGGKDMNRVITGDELIVLAQVISASQMVIEEKFVYKYNVSPLQVVGWEGFFGFTVLGILLFPMYFIYIGPGMSTNPHYRLEDALDGFCQIANSPFVALGTIGNIFSIAFFNFAGISVTREMSATTRMVLDSVRTLIVWAVSLAVGWQMFAALQILGFALLVFGTLLYTATFNSCGRRIYNRCRGREASLEYLEEEDPLINDASSPRGTSTPS